MSRILDRIERELKDQKRTRAQVWTRRLSIILLTLAIPLLGGELALRLAGYSRPQIDFPAQKQSLQKATDALNHRFNTNAFEFDPHLLWKLKPGGNLAGLDVDTRGLLTWERPAQGPRNARPVTVLCLGDSVTAITYRTFPQIAELLAAAGTTARPVHIYSAAVPGYTTEQALRQLPTLKDLQPDVVVLCFGWNDHFPALNLPDHELGAANAGEQILHNALKDVRLYQLVGAPLGARTSEDEASDDPPANATYAAIAADFRVAPPQFESNLNQLVDIIRSWSAMPILATQPENLKPTTEQFLQDNNFIAPNQRDNKSLHSQYNEIVRAVATNQNVPLLDIEAEFIRRPRDFMLEPDGIHLTGRGHNHVARLVLAALRNQGKITEGDYNLIARSEKHDTTAPDKPRVSWSVKPEHLAAVVGQPFSFSVIPQNSGNTRWIQKNIIRRFGLEKNVSYGSSSVFTRWRTLDSPTSGIAQVVPIPSDVLPGEATSMTLTMKAPTTAGNYELEIGIIADQVGPLTAYGAESTTLTVTAVEP